MVTCYRGISIYDEVTENEEYSKEVRINNHFHGVVEEIDDKGIARIRMFCGCREHINVHWLKKVTPKHDHCCCHHHHH